MTFKCDYCNKTFDKSPAMVNRNSTKCCSVECSKELIKSKRIRKTCKYCKKVFNLKPSQKFLTCCSKECSLKYKEEYPKGKPVMVNGKLLCVRCEQYKDLDKFYDTGHQTSNNVRSNKMVNCKECHIEIGNDQRKKRISSIEGTLRELLKRSRTVKKGKLLGCDLDIEYLIELYNKQDGKCALSGVVMEIASYYNLKGISIDRINCEQGYLKGNIQLLCWGVNQMKNDLDNQELIDWCNKISKHNIKEDGEEA